MPTPHDLVEALEHRVATDGARPLLTCYQVDEGSRVEFSAHTFANWVDKTANLIGSLGLDDQADVAVPLLRTHPGHWVGLVWTMATWQVGGSVLALPREDLDRVELAVVGPEHAHPVPGVETVVCSLHPLGGPLAQPVVGVTDYAEVLSQPDVHWRNTAPRIWLDGGELRVDDEQVALVEPSSGRRLVTPGGEVWPDLVAMLAAPLLGGGSVVLVRGTADADELARIAAQEQAELLH